MNKRIADLMRSRGLHAYITEDCQHRMEMLADVIVRECVWIIDNDGTSEDILKHFGIEE